MLIGCGSRTRTCDLMVMSHPSYHCSIPQCWYYPILRICLPLASTLPNKVNLSGRMAALDNISIDGCYDHIYILIWFVEPRGLEPRTLCLQSRRSRRLSYDPIYPITLTLTRLLHFGHLISIVASPLHLIFRSCRSQTYPSRPMCGHLAEANLPPSLLSPVVSIV